MKFVIKGKLDGLNEIIKANRTNKYAGAKIKKQNEAIVIYYARFCRMQPITEYPVKAIIHWYEPNRCRDWDNVMSAKKFIFDGLHKIGILNGDGQKYINQIEEYQHIDRENPRIEVEFLKGVEE